MDKLNEAIYTNIMDVASVESKALEAHEDWFRHIKDCPQCSNGPFCERGEELNAIAEKWERRCEDLGVAEAGHHGTDGCLDPRYSDAGPDPDRAYDEKRLYGHSATIEPNGEAVNFRGTTGPVFKALQLLSTHPRAKNLGSQVYADACFSEPLPGGRRAL